MLEKKNELTTEEKDHLTRTMTLRTIHLAAEKSNLPPIELAKQLKEATELILKWKINRPE